MRAFSLKGRQAVNLSLPGVGMPSLFSPRRGAPSVSTSKPASPQRTPSSLPLISDRPESALPPVDKTDDSFEISVEPPSRRSPSPTPTEVLDPEPEEIEEVLQRHKITVRDFAYEYPSFQTEEEDPDNPFAPVASTSTAATRGPKFRPATEIFDQYKGIVEYEYRLAQTPRTVPISGKVLRRLLDIRWVTMEEAKSRLHQMDWEAMKIYEAKSADYPWRPCKWSTIPDAAGRVQLLADRGAWFAMVDRMRQQVEAYAAWEKAQEERERKAVEDAQERIKQMEAERQGGMGMIMDPYHEEADDDDEPLVNGYAPVGTSTTVCPPIPIPNGSSALQYLSQLSLDDVTATGKKRTLEHSMSTPSFSTSPSTSTGPKRVRLDAEKPLPAIPPSDDTAATCSRPTTPPNKSTGYMLPPGLTPPRQQYPAPLSTYDPNLYPDAARVIQETRTSGPAREDTPPLEEEEDQDQGGSGWKGSEKPGGGLPLQRKRRGSALSRTQTYRQF